MVACLETLSFLCFALEAGYYGSRTPITSHSSLWSRLLALFALLLAPSDLICRLHFGRKSGFGSDDPKIRILLGSHLRRRSMLERKLKTFQPPVLEEVTWKPEEPRPAASPEGRLGHHDIRAAARCPVPLYSTRGRFLPAMK